MLALDESFKPTVVEVVVIVNKEDEVIGSDKEEDDDEEINLAPEPDIQKMSRISRKYSKSNTAQLLKERIKTTKGMKLLEMMRTVKAMMIVRYFLIR